MKIIRTSTQSKILSNQLTLVETVHITLEQIFRDLSYDLGAGILKTPIGEEELDEKFNLTLKDHFGSCMDIVISEGLDLVHKLGLNENFFRDELDRIFEDSEIFDGEYKRLMGFTAHRESMKVYIMDKYWWSRNKRIKNSNTEY
jgi:hypothetical protein